MHNRTTLARHRDFGGPGGPRAALVMSGTAMLAATASAGVVTAAVSISDGPPITVSIAGTPAAFGGELFQHTVTIDDVTISWSYTVKIDAAQNRILSGSTTVTNATASLKTVDAMLSTTLEQPLVDDVLTGGTVSAKLITNADGGVLLCGGEDALVQAVSDGEPVTSFFECPFQMVASGASAGSTSASWGLPIPSAAGPRVVGTLGHRIGIAVTPGDKAVLTMLFAAKGEVAAAPPIVTLPDIGNG